MTLTTIIGRLPPRDQMAFRLIAHAVNAGALADDPRETVRRCYALGDAYLDAARESWPGRKAEADEEKDHAPA